MEAAGFVGRSEVRQPMTEDEAQQTERYTKIVIDRVLEAAQAAVKDLAAVH